MFLEVTLVICIPILTWEIKMTFGSTNLIQPSGWRFESHRVALNQCHVQLTVRLYIKSGSTYSLAMTVIFLAQVYIYSRVFIERKYLWFEWNVSKKNNVNFPGRYESCMGSNKYMWFRHYIDLNKCMSFKPKSDKRLFVNCSWVVHCAVIVHLN